MDALTENPALALGRDKLDPSDPLYVLFSSVIAFQGLLNFRKVICLFVILLGLWTA